jgi:aspartyl-tRNA synthetase
MSDHTTTATPLHTQRTHIGDVGAKKGETVCVEGWVHIRRDQGKMIFLDFRDASGIIQGVILSGNATALEVGKTLRPEFVVRVEGKVNERPEKNKKPGVNGDIELEILSIEVLNESETTVPARRRHT